MQLLSVAGPSVSARSGTFTRLFQCALRRTSPGFSRQGVGFEGGSKHLEIQGGTVSDRLKPGLHTQCPSSPVKYGARAAAQYTTLLRGYSIIPSAPAAFNAGISSPTT